MEMNLNIADEDPVLGTDFAVEMVRQVRALDPYGRFDDQPASRILDPYVLTKEQKKKIPIIGDPDEVAVSRVKAFCNAIAALIEAECDQMAVPTVNLTHEGFGRALITVGKLVVMDKTLRDVHRFSFPTLSKTKDEADKIPSVALEIVGEYPKALKAAETERA
jgi:probable nitrogen fixation protein